MKQRKSQKPVITFKRHRNIIRKGQAGAIQNQKAEQLQIRSIERNVFWSNFFRSRHKHQNSAQILAFLDLLLEEISQFYSRDYSEMDFQDQTVYFEVGHLLEQIRLQNILTAVKNVLECQSCSLQISSASKVIIEKYQSFVRCICCYQQINFNNFQVYLLYYDIMNKIYAQIVKGNQLLWNRIQQRTFRNHHNQAYFKCLQGNKPGQCEIRLTLITILIGIAKASQQSENKKYVSMFLKVYNANYQKDNLALFVIWVIAEKQLGHTLGSYFRDSITGKLVDIVKCSNHSDDVKQRLIYRLMQQHKKSATDSQKIDATQQLRDTKAADNERGQLSRLERGQQIFKNKQIVVQQQKQIVTLSFEQQIQKAFAIVQSNLPNSAVQNGLLFLSSLKIDGRVKSKSHRISILQRLFELSQSHAVLAKSCIQNGLRLLSICQFVEKVNITLVRCGARQQQAYRLSLKQNLMKYQGVAKKINIAL